MPGLTEDYSLLITRDRESWGTLVEVDFPPVEDHHLEQNKIANLGGAR